MAPAVDLYRATGSRVDAVAFAGAQLDEPRRSPDGDPPVNLKLSWAQKTPPVRVAAPVGWRRPYRSEQVGQANPLGCR
jgi:hypothetical protein